MSGDKENLPVKKIKFKELFETVLAEFPEKYDALRRVTVTVSSNISSIQFNTNALKVIVGNLIENSLLYSNEQERVFVDVDAVIDQRHMSNRELMRMTVRDTGEGVPEEYLQKIFSPFVRLHADKAEGSGLGLTLVRSLVELYGGEISASSENGRGTTIFITIPIAAEEREQMVI
jgi:two-component system sensor histidine kinase VicK